MSYCMEIHVELFFFSTLHLRKRKAGTRFLMNVGQRFCGNPSKRNAFNFRREIIVKFDHLKGINTQHTVVIWVNIFQTK